MNSQTFINLPVKDLKKTVDFFTHLGYTFNPQFTDENATCMIINDNTFVMLLVEPFFQTFIKKGISDASKTAEVILSFSAENRDKVDEMIRKAKEKGATTPMDSQDHGWMYQHGFQDLDGHLWEYAYIDVSAIPQQ